MHRSLPAQYLGKERVDAILTELGKRVVVETQRLTSFLQLVCHLGHFDQEVRTFYIIGFLNHVDRPGLRSS